MEDHKTVGLIVKPGVDEAKALAKELISYLDKKNIPLILEESSASILNSKLDSLPSSELVRKADPIVSLGGDGTLISLARHTVNPSPIMLGVNFGHLGFLTEVTPKEFFPVFEDVLSGKARTGKRRILSVKVLRGDKEIYNSQAVNDAVVQKKSESKLIEFDVEVSGEDVFRIKSDGVIISTPVGSTAYCLSAGGAILHPTLSVIEVTAICAHSLTFRPLVLPMEHTIRVRAPNQKTDVMLIVDGQESLEVGADDIIQIIPSENSVEFVRSPSRTYFEILRTKLNWNVVNQEKS